MSWNILTQRAKAIAAVAYSVLTGLSYVTLPDPYNKYVALGLLILGPIVVHQVPNADKPVAPAPPANQ